MQTRQILKTLSVGLEPVFSTFCKQLELPVHMGRVFMGKIFHSYLIIFVCIRLYGIIMEKHRLWTSEWEFSMKMFNFPHENALRKIFFSFFFSFLLHPQLTPALMGLYDHCQPWQLSASASSSLSVSCLTLGVTSLGRWMSLALQSRVSS